MTPEQFDSYKAEGFNRIPVMREIPADLDTPLTIYLKLASEPYGYLFESVQGGEKWGRYSIIGLPCATRLEIRDRQVSLIQQGQISDSYQIDNPLAEIERFQARFRVPEYAQLPRFHGGLVGYFGYDTIAYIEPHLRNTDKPDPLQTPDILLMVSEEVVIFDNATNRLLIVVHANIEAGDTLDTAQARIDALIAKMQTDIPRHAVSQHKLDEADFVSGFSEQAFKAGVERIRQYILDGDCMQVVLSQRMSVPFSARPLDLYRALRQLNPSPYMYFMDLEGFQIVGSSPEILVHLEQDTITVRPIAGTRRRGHTEAEDLALEAELLADPKELAEHLMLIDLGRNDAGRIAQTGSVQLTEKMVIERYSHVMHIVSNIQGKLKPDLSALDVLSATFPAGTVSGAPKIRALEIIDELEPVKRGIYSGAIGYMAWSGNMDTAIAIRTAVIKDQQLHIQAGAGIVADSQPELEWQETMNKGRAIFRAAALAEAGLETGLAQ